MGNKNMKNLLTVLYIILSIMFSSVSMNQSFLKASTSDYHKRSIEEDCSNFSVEKDVVLSAKCEGKIHKLELKQCVSYKESTFIAFEPNLQLLDDCRHFNIEKVTRKDGASQLLFTGICKLTLLDKNAKAETNHATIPLNQFLKYDGERLECGDINNLTIKRFKKKEIDEKCRSLEIHNSGIITGICDIGKNHFHDEIRFPYCVDPVFFEHATYGFTNDCLYCSGYKLSGINILACTCRDIKNRTKKIFGPLHDYVKINGDKLECVIHTDKKHILRKAKNPEEEPPSKPDPNIANIPDKPIVKPKVVVIPSGINPEPKSTPSKEKEEDEKKKKINKKITKELSKIDAQGLHMRNF